MARRKHVCHCATKTEKEALFSPGSYPKVTTGIIGKKQKKQNKDGGGKEGEEGEWFRGKTRVMTWWRALWVCSPIDVFPFTSRTSKSCSLLFQTCLHWKKRRFINTYKTILVEGQQTTSVNKYKPTKTLGTLMVLFCKEPSLVPGLIGQKLTHTGTHLPWDSIFSPIGHTLL